jgi:hypothetical protein
MAVGRAVDLKGDTLRVRVCEMEWLEVSQSVGSVSKGTRVGPVALMPLVSGLDQGMNLLTLARRESAQREPKYPVPKVWRSLPRDKSKDRQIRREPNAQYLQYHHHEYLNACVAAWVPERRGTTSALPVASSGVAPIGIEAW